MTATMRVVLCLVILVLKIVDAQPVLRLQNPRLMNCGFDRIYQIGDSMSDTGNCIRERLCGAHSLCIRPPYGINFFQNITGRCSNGMLIIDFIALESGLPLLNPWEDEHADFSHGVNFAVSGATALSAEYLAENHFLNIGSTNSTFSVQLDWMSSHLHHICSNDCPEKLNKSLFLIGEIGGNEVIFGLIQRKPLDELRRLIPKVVQTIIHGVKRVINFGATRIIVPGNIAIGCHPIFLTQFKTDNSSAYDEYHCVKDINNFVSSYNLHLQQAIDDLKKDYPNISLIYGDIYNAFMWLLQNAVSLGFDSNSLHKACCGIGGEYNYDEFRQCGSPRVPVCVDPSVHISWDGVHLTQNAYSWVARWLIDDMLPKLNCQV